MIEKTNRAEDSAYERIYAVVSCVPRGRVSTYGEVARRAGLEGRARQVGYALHALDEGRDVPWQRIVNASGRISGRREPEPACLQRDLLEAEGVVFDARGVIDLGRFAWRS
ncbi:MAG: MGMT family protein [Myxococcota bacterium]|nr:MGMT family protein [Myxococcota bacterium]